MLIIVAYYRLVMSKQTLEQPPSVREGTRQWKESLLITAGKSQGRVMNECAPWRANEEGETVGVWGR